MKETENRDRRSLLPASQGSAPDERDEQLRAEACAAFDQWWVENRPWAKATFNDLGMFAHGYKAGRRAQSDSAHLEPNGKSSMTETALTDFRPET